MKNEILNLQYQYSKLFNLGLNRKKFECIPAPYKLYALNTSKNTFIALFFTLASFLFPFFVLIQILGGKNEIPINFIIVFFIINFSLGVLGLRQFLWLINGRQIMTIENGCLTLTKGGIFFTKAKSYSLDLVANIRLAEDEDNSSLVDKIQNNIALNRKVLFGHITGQILFDYKGETIKVFNDLDKNERIMLIHEMNKLK